MKVGLVARCDQRGLGYLTHAAYRHLQPERTLVIRMGDDRGFVQHTDRYPGETVVTFDGHYLPEDVVRPWLRGLDVVYSAETFYDWQMVRWAKEEGVATVLHSMPEFWKHRTEPLPWPARIWATTSWKLDIFPPGVQVVPVPVEEDVFPLTEAGTGNGFPSDPLRVVHVAGHRAAGDRNGTLQLLAAAQQVREPMVITVHCQDSHLPRVRALSPGVELHMVPGGQRTRPELYAGHHLMVFPRRYGGLSLPAQEALASGLGLAMSDACPNGATWPILPLKGRYDARQPTPCGPVRSFCTDATYLARVLELHARLPKKVAALQEAGTAWAREHSWSALAPLYRDLLAEACS